MKHEIVIPEELKARAAQLRQHLQENKESYRFGLGGIIVGIVGTRTFSRPKVMTTVVVYTSAVAPPANI